MSEINQGDEIFFERNDGQTHNDVNPTVIAIRKILNGMPDGQCYDDPTSARKRVGNKLLDIMSIQSDVNNFKPELIVGNVDAIDEDMLCVGTIIDRMLVIDIPPIMVQLDLVQAIRNAMLHKKPNIIRLMTKKSINLFQLEPRVMIMCAEMEMDDLLEEMIENKIPLYTEQYKCIYCLASKGKLEILKKIMKNYRFPNITEIVGKICIQSIINNHLNVLQYFCPPEAFEGAPDVMFTFFIKGIEFGGHLAIIKYFVDGGISIKQQNYYAITLAKQFHRGELIKYFYEIDPSIDSLFTIDEKEKYNLIELREENQRLEKDTLCNIYCDEISTGDRYFQCENNKHHFDHKAWKRWTEKNSSWKCPACMSPVKKIIYTNV